MDEARVCVKTPKGIEEVAQRTHNISQRERRLLIMIDGSRNSASLAAMITGENVPAMLDKLLAEGFIAPLAVAKPERAGQPVVDAAKRFEMAHNFMLNTVNAFLGVFGSGLIEKLETARTLEDLRGHYVGWRDSMQLTPEGRKRSKELEEKLAALLS